MWFDADSGAVITWLLGGAAHVAGVQTVNVPCDRASGCSFNWKPIAVGDVNDDGHADVLWWNRYSRIVSAWLLDGAGHMLTRLDLDWRCEGGTLGTCAGEWRPVGLGDLNGDGHQDLMWYDSTTGEVSTWLLNGYGNVVTKQSLQWGAATAAPARTTGSSSASSTRTAASPTCRPSADSVAAPERAGPLGRW
jgi:hypothetical protein